MSKKLDAGKLGLIGVALAVALLIAVNVVANGWLSNIRADFTEGRAYTTSEQIKPIFSGIGEPVVVRLYYTEAIGQASQRHALYYQRVRDLLQQYAKLAKGKIKVELYNPEPFSEVEDRAVGFGLQAVPISSNGEVGYFGLAATNSTDEQQVIPFFSLEREQFLEYDLTKLIYSLSRANPPKVGLLTSLPINGGGANPMQMRMGGGTPPWAIMQQVQELFTVQTLDPNAAEIPKDIDTLMLVQPGSLPEPTQRAIDQFVMNGGKVLLFVDPHAESNVGGQMGLPLPGADLAGIKKLMAAWGVKMVDGAVVGDIDAAIRVNMAANGRPVVVDYVAWMQVMRQNIDANDSITGDLKQVNFGTAGALEAVDGSGTTVTPLLVTGPRSMRIPAQNFEAMPDIVAMFRDFKPADRREVLAARITGKAKSAFPDAPLKESKQPINVVVVADTDMLADRFWVQTIGQGVAVPTADNSNFVNNALENLTGAPALSALRGRGVQSRPFKLLDDIRRDAELQYREKEQGLSSHLEELEKKLGAMQMRPDGSGQVTLSDDDRKTVEAYRGEILTTRRALRDVQRALRQNLETLQQTITFADIGAVPVIFGLILVAVAVSRRRKHRSADIVRSNP